MAAMIHLPLTQHETRRIAGSIAECGDLCEALRN